MDSATLKHMILRNSTLSVSFAGIWSADNINLQLETSEMTTNFLASEPLVWFQIVNTCPETHMAHTGCFSELLLYNDERNCWCSSGTVWVNECMSTQRFSIA